MIMRPLFSCSERRLKNAMAPPSSNTARGVCSWYPTDSWISSNLRHSVFKFIQREKHVTNLSVKIEIVCLALYVWTKRSIYKKKLNSSSANPFTVFKHWRNVRKKNPQLALYVDLLSYLIRNRHLTSMVNTDCFGSLTCAYCCN